MELTWYHVLGVDPDATTEELRAAYRAQARRLHPDAGGTGSGEEMRLLQEAWAVLGDPDRRRQYDATLPLVGEKDWEERAVRPTLFRPWVAMVVVLALIFVITAYAAPH